ncbi:MAG: exopolyphosphatase [bacterium]
MFRVTTRADWDGLVSAALLSIVEDVDRYRFIEPGPFQVGEGEVTPEDIIANLPYRHGCALWFDHHISNKLKGVDFRGSWWVAPSAARVIYEFYNHDDSLSEFEEVVAITDRIDSASLTRDEVVNPRKLLLVSITVDGKRTVDEPYWLTLIALLVKNDQKALETHPQVASRCKDFLDDQERFSSLLKETAILEKGVLITDWRGMKPPELANRFLPFALFPDTRVWVKIIDHPQELDRTHLSVSLSIFQPVSEINVGELMARYGGGGHRGAGTCRPYKTQADQVLKEVVSACQIS